MYRPIIRCGIRVLVNDALAAMNTRFNEIYADTGRDSIAPEKLIRALLLQVFYLACVNATFAARGLRIAIKSATQTDISLIVSRLPEARDPSVIAPTWDWIGTNVKGRQKHQPSTALPDQLAYTRFDNSSVWQLRSALKLA